MSIQKNTWFVIVVWVTVEVLASSHAFAKISKQAFAQRALRVIEKNYPEQKCLIKQQDTLLVCGDVAFGLENVRRKLESDGIPEASWDQMIAFYYGIAMGEAYQGGKALNEKSSDLDITQSGASGTIPNSVESPEGEPKPSNVYLQIVPDTYEKQIGKDNIVPFLPGLSIAISMDHPDRVEYVLDRHLDEMQLSREQLTELANKNLLTKSRSTALEAAQPKDKSLAGKWLAVSVKDGFAAARILVPEFRQRMSDELGENFYVAMPNRDFLIAWSMDYSYHLDFMMNVRKDFESQPHPLSGEVYIGSAQGLREAEPSELLPEQSMNFDE